MKIKILLFFVLFNFKSQAQTLGVIFNGLETTAKNILNDANYAMNNTVNNAAINAINAIEQFKNSYGDILDKTVGELNQQQYQIFDGIKRQVEDIFYNIENAQERLDNSVNGLALHIGHTWAGDKLPRVSQSMVPTIIQGDNRNTIISFKGAFLRHEDNRLIVDGFYADRIKMTDTELSFKIPSRVFERIGTQIELYDMELRCYFKKGFLFKRKKFYEYEYFVKVIPNTIASVQVEYILDDMVTKTYQRTESWALNCKSDWKGKRGRSSESVNVLPRDGWLIDIESVAARWDGSSGCNNSASIRVGTKSSKGFVVNMNCVTDSKSSVRCRYKGIVTFKEYKNENKEITKKSDWYEMTGTKDVVLTMPEKTKHWSSIKIKHIDGSIQTITAEGRQGQFLVDYKKITRKLRVTAILNAF